MPKKANRRANPCSDQTRENKMEEKHEQNFDVILQLKSSAQHTAVLLGQRSPPLGVFMGKKYILIVLGCPGHS